ncbi:MAG: lysophospholipid acyltransferase family protein [Longimicrobiales bacterium]
MRKVMYFVEYALLRFVVGILTRIPQGLASRMGATLGGLGYSPLGIRREVVDANLLRAFPEKDDAWRRDVARKSYEHLGREIIAMLRLSHLDEAEIMRQTSFTDRDQADELFRAKGKGAVIVVGHFGNWELGAATMATRGYPLDVIAKRQKNPYFDHYIVAARNRLGVRIIERSRAPKEGLRSLRQGRVVVFGADQNAGRGGVFVPFFGHLASTHRGAALMAIRTGAPVIMALPRRLPDGTYCTVVEVIEPNPESIHEENEIAMEILTARFTKRLEEEIRKYPDQYLWHHRRWKTPPP